MNTLSFVLITQPASSLLLRVVICTLIFAATPIARAIADEEPAKKQNTHRVRILIPPKSSSPFDWKAQQKVTLGVSLISENKTKVIGLATDIHLIASKSRENRVELLLLVTKQEKEAILAAAKLSELWFVAMPFKPEHKQVFAKEVRYTEFMKNHQDYRPAGERQWNVGIGKDNSAPTPAEIRAIRKADMQEVSQD